MPAPEIFVVAAVRTAIGSFGGSLKDVAPSRLATLVTREALARGRVDPGQVGSVVLGHVLPTEPRDAYLSRVAAIEAGIPKETPAFNVNRLCGSGMQAIVSAAQSLALGECAVAVAAGVESMSRAAYLLPAARWGARMGDSAIVDYMLGALQDPFDNEHMGITAENVASTVGVSREDQDALAAESHRRASLAIAEGRFVDQIVPIEIARRGGSIRFEVDEHVRPDTTIEQLAKLKPAFRQGGTVTAGNSSGLNDGAAAVVLATADAVRALGLTPLARLVSWGHAGVDPKLMGLGPIPASRLALKRAGLSTSDLDVIESNEAFAAQACAVSRGLDLDPAKVNPNGSGISLGHPVGASGVVIATKAIHELQRSTGRHALATMCIGGGQGIATVFERV